MEPHEKKEFTCIVNLLKKEFPAKYPIRVRTKSLKRYHGLTGFYDGEAPYFLITIGKDRFDVMVMALLHEWSHALAWENRFNIDGKHEYHTDKWSLMYKKVYNFTWKNFLKQP